MTFIYKEVVVPKTTKTEVITVCDSCNTRGYRCTGGLVDWTVDDGYNGKIAETCVMVRVGASERDGGSESTTTEWHICPACFTKMVTVAVNPTITKTET